MSTKPCTFFFLRLEHPKTDRAPTELLKKC